jgi:hypothetical protein
MTDLIYHLVHPYETLPHKHTSQVIPRDSMSLRLSSPRECLLRLLNHYLPHFQDDLEAYQIHRLQFQYEPLALTLHLHLLHE